MTRDSLVMAATSKNSRKKRFAIGLLACISGWIFYAVFVIAPWGFIYTRMARPHCEAGEPDHVNEWGYLGTTGGWKSDWDATWYEYMIILIQVFVLFVEGIVTAPFCGPCNRIGNTNVDGMAVDRGIVDTAKFVTNKAAYRRLFKVLIYPLVIGVIVLIAGQAVSGARFGMAWAEGVVGQQMHTDEATGVVTPRSTRSRSRPRCTTRPSPCWPSRRVRAGHGRGDAAPSDQRRRVLLGDALLWLAGARRHLCAAAADLRQRALGLQRGRANKDCASFPDTGYDFSKTACEARFWTFIPAASSCW